MKILHTSDWHIGRALYGRKRYEEYRAFFSWLLHTIETHGVDVLVVAGDIFDSTTPSNRAQELYFQFIRDVASSCCRHVVIVGGNHDSPSLLEAPRELLRYFQVHVVGKAAATPADEVLVLKDSQGNDELIVCGVPYLRDREIRTSLAGEHIDDKNRKLLEGIAHHYRQVVDAALHHRQMSSSSLPIIATGHLFVAGGSKVEGDGVRDLYVGSLAHVPPALIPDEIDYLALGHLHVAQRVGARPCWRYSGSPLPMSFHEAEKNKFVLIVDIEPGRVDVHEVQIPRFQRLETLRGDLDTLLDGLGRFREEGESIWLEVHYDGNELVPQLQLTLQEATADSGVEILRVVNNRLAALVLEQTHPAETLDSLTEETVFRRCLEVHQVSDDQAAELLVLFGETLQAIADEDHRAD